MHQKMRVKIWKKLYVLCHQGAVKQCAMYEIVQPRSQGLLRLCEVRATRRYKDPGLRGWKLSYEISGEVRVFSFTS